MEKRKVEVAIKKSVNIKQLVTNDGEAEEDVSVKPTNLREDPRLSPFKPGPGPNPKPKHYGIIPKKK